MSESAQAQATCTAAAAAGRRRRRRYAAGRDALRRTLAAFAYRDFRVQWIGACTSSIGTWMQIVAQNWLIVSLTNSSPFFLGLDAFLQQLPIILFSLVGGVFADRYDRRRTLLGVAVSCRWPPRHARAADVSPASSQIWHVLALSFVTGCRAVVRRPGVLSR